MKTTLLVLCLIFASCSSIIIEKKCNYILPNNLSLVYSESSKMYAIKINESSEYLSWYQENRSIYHSTKPELFYDSCEAKDFVYKCIIQDYGKITDLKK